MNASNKTHPACTIHKDGMWLPLWLDWKTVTYAKISPKMVNLREIAEECRRKISVRYFDLVIVSTLNLHFVLKCLIFWSHDSDILISWLSGKLNLHFVLKCLIFWIYALNGQYFCFLSRSFMVPFQTSFLSMDENKALSPKQLQKRLSTMLEQHPDIAEAVSVCYYLWWYLCCYRSL